MSFLCFSAQVNLDPGGCSHLLRCWGLLASSPVYKISSKHLPFSLSIHLTDLTRWQQNIVFNWTALSYTGMSPAVLLRHAVVTGPVYGTDMEINCFGSL